MSVILYAVTEAGRRAPDGDGLHGQPLRCLVHHSLAAIVSNSDSPPSQDEESLWLYESTIEGLMARGPVLPARYGTVAATDCEIFDTLQARHDELVRTLDRVRGAVEFAVRIKPKGGPATSKRLVVPVAKR